MLFMPAVVFSTMSRVSLVLQLSRLVEGGDGGYGLRRSEGGGERIRFLDMGKVCAAAPDIGNGASTPTISS